MYVCMYASLYVSTYLCLSSLLPPLKHTYLPTYLQGNYLNDLIVYECGTKSFSRPTVIGKTPIARADTEMVGR